MDMTNINRHGLTNFNGFDAFAESSVFESVIGKEALNFNIAFICFYGSRNYSLETDKSDYDFFITYYPAFCNFYNNKFERFSVIEKDYDYFITPFHEYVRHAMNGNIKFIEPIVCGTVFFIKEAETGLKAIKIENYFLFEKVKKFISINYKKNFNAITGMANNKILNVTKELYTSNTLKYKETHGYDIKEAINSLRILFLLGNYIKTGQFSFTVRKNPVYKDFEDYLSGINEKNISKENYLKIADNKINDIMRFSKEVDLLDGKVKKIRVETEREIKNDLMKICKDNACIV
ncbi:MAG: hypothetical protein ACYCTD_03780 [bacterium]